MIDLQETTTAVKTKENACVVGFMFSNDMKQVALIRKTKPKWQEGLLNGIGGKVEEHELDELGEVIFDKTMVREFEEETGYTTSEEQWEDVVTILAPDFQMLVMATFGNLSALETKEEEEVVVVSVDEIDYSQCVENLVWLIPLCKERLLGRSPTSFIGIYDFAK